MQQSSLPFLVFVLLPADVASMDMHTRHMPEPTCALLLLANCWPVVYVQHHGGARHGAGCRDNAPCLLLSFSGTLLFQCMQGPPL